ncbi:nucleotidyltransferase [Shouchella shacheensis]|uniref:nucleotidyltransferase n=1 Tax=Shouchella shacheensis TaxID=1649580 RepID=UPI00073FF2EF|nr:nucleotidyltransferase [Shouchella shacheensis]
MQAVGVVVEYNPFHNGHLHHVASARKQSQADVVIAVMSGSFLQRGEPALLSKWARTRMALASGVDIVIELPYAYSVQKAERFAEGAVKALDALGTSSINFGSEAGDIEAFKQLLTFMKTHQDPYHNAVRTYVKEGISYPAAQAKAFQSLNPDRNLLALSTPNNILGYHYVKALNDFNLRPSATTTPRTQSGYHDLSLGVGSIASATSIRKALMGEKDLKAIARVVPESTLAGLESYEAENGLFHTWENYFPYLQHRVLTASLAELASVYECEEGLEYRMRETIAGADSFSSWISQLKTKRYTHTRLQRLITHLLTNTTKEELDTIHSQKTLPYVRLLGMTADGKRYLNKQKKKMEIPLISRLAKVDGLMGKLDIRSSRVYCLAFPAKLGALRMKEEFSTTPIRME